MSLFIKKPMNILNWRCNSGLFFLNIQIPAHTSMKANKVPMLVIEPTMSSGINAENKPTSTKKIQLAL